MEKKSRIVIVGFFACLLILPLLINAISQRIVYSHSQLYDVMDGMTKNSWDENGFAILQKRQQINQDNWVLNFSLGVIYKKKGKFSEATTLLTEVLEKKPTSPQVFVNMGNVFLSKGDAENAVKYYRRAKEIDDTLFETYINLGRALGELGRIEEATKEFAQALDIDSARAVHYMNREDGNFNQKIPDCPLPSEALTDIQNFFTSEISTLSSAIWRIVFGDVTSRTYFLCVIISILTTAVYYRLAFAEEGRSTLCNNCGVIFKSTVAESDKEYHRCNDCIILDIDSYHIDTLKKNEIEERIKKYKKTKRITSILVNVFFPGAGAIIYKRIVYGTIHLMITGTIIAEIFFQLVLLRGMPENSMYSFLCVAGMVFYYVVANSVGIKKITS